MEGGDERRRGGGATAVMARGAAAADAIAERPAGNYGSGMAAVATVCAAMAGACPIAKVFWFFFSKKNIFLFLLHPGSFSRGII